MNDTIDHLKEARSIIEKPEHWCKGKYAMDDKGNAACVDGSQAVAWCMLGAVHKAILTFSKRHSPEIFIRYTEATRALAYSLGNTVLTLSVYNDTHTHEEVIALLDKAIALIAQSFSEAKSISTLEQA